ncbi:MAG: 50S ribosomal protein L21 [Vampirovibrionales bacterium]|nr:50S ribosomal protein L21 [Vampirovibrionales bacterium]
MPAAKASKSVDTAEKSLKPASKTKKTSTQASPSASPSEGQAPEMAPKATAIVSISGKQYKVEAGRYTDIDLLDHPENETLTFDAVLWASDAAGKSWLGAPTVAGAKVELTILKHWRDTKVIVFKYRCKKGTRKKNGHRQSYTRVMINSIQLPA